MLLEPGLLVIAPKSYYDMFVVRGRLRREPAKYNCACMRFPSSVRPPTRFDRSMGGFWEMSAMGLTNTPWSSQLV